MELYETSANYEAEGIQEAKAHAIEMEQREETLRKLGLSEADLYEDLDQA